MTIALLPVLFANGETLSSEFVFLLVVSLLFVFTTFYLSVVAIPGLRKRLEETKDSSTKASKASELERQELNHKLRLLYRENKILQSKVESSDSAANIRPLLNIARIDNHVIRMTKDRIEHDRCLDKRAAARREASWSQRLRHAALDRHVRTLTQGRLEYAAGDERAASAARQTQADLQIRQHSETIASTRCRLKRSILDLHVKSKLAE
ncbi:MAG: hypothetical protein ACI9HK_005590, partial [Pirellulaceae bacterium]